MGFLTIFCEKSFPHAGSLLEYSSGQREWLSFMPKPDDFLGGNGFIDTRNREGSIKHYIRYPISDGILRHARENVVSEYWTEVYQIGTSDCVSFARAIAKACGMFTLGITFLPATLVFDLKQYWAGFSEFDVHPFPWETSSPNESVRHSLAGTWSVQI